MICTCAWDRALNMHACTVHPVTVDNDGDGPPRFSWWSSGLADAMKEPTQENPTVSTNTTDEPDAPPCGPDCTCEGI